MPLTHAGGAAAPLFDVAMRWGQQPVRLTGVLCSELPTDAPVLSAHVAAFCGEKLLLVRDRRGTFGFPGGRLEPSETCDEALRREVYEEARAHLDPAYRLYSVLKVEYTERLPHRAYPHDFTYVAMFVGCVRALEPIGADPAGIVTARELFSVQASRDALHPHNWLLVELALRELEARGGTGARAVRAWRRDVCPPGSMS